MKYLHYSIQFASLLLIIMFTTVGIDAEENKADPNDKTSISLSGKVVDTEGQPIPGFTFSIQSSKNPNIHFHSRIVRVPDISTNRPIVVNNTDETQISITKVKTDAKGTFSVSKIRPGYVSIVAIPKEKFDEKRKNENIPPQPHPHIIVDVPNGNRELDGQIVNIRLNKITFYSPQNSGPFPGLMFGIKSEVSLKDVIITVKRSLKIRSRILYKDGTPVANTSPNLTIYYHGGPFGGADKTDPTTCETDSDGYFTQSREEPGFYSIKANYKGFTGAAGPFLLDHGIHPSELVIRLNGSPIDKKSPEKMTTKLRQDKSRVFVRNLLGNNKPDKNGDVNSERLVWIINPANGHAYAKINCQGWHDAQRKAIAENAHLVSINDQEELFWVQTIFTDHFYWLGLNDVEDEGIWRWDSGEPVTFTFWTERDIFRDTTPDSEKDYVASTYFDNGWFAAGKNSQIWSMTRLAIIEKDGLVSKIPKSKDATED